MGTISQPSDEAASLAAARGGSHTARETLFRDNWGPAWRRAYALVGDRATAEDIVQDSFERAFEALTSFEGRSSFRTWLLSIVTNRALDVLRRRHNDGSLEEAPGVEPDWPEDPGERGRVRRAVAGLPPDRQAVVVLVYWLDLTLLEAAEALGVPQGTVKSRLARALEQLRASLGVNDVA